jgi:hypothetical protein
MEALYPGHLASGNANSPPIVVLDSFSVCRCPRALQQCLDSLGAASAHAQRLPAAITSASRMSLDSSQRVYIALPWGYTGGQPCVPLGFLKVGQRALYLSAPARAALGGPVPDPSTMVASLAASSKQSNGGGQRGGRGDGGRRMGGAGSMWECNPLCVLDFFVEEASRRRGVGRALFDCMMRSEGVAHPAVLAFVRAPDHATIFFGASRCLKICRKRLGLFFFPPDKGASHHI